MNEVEKMYRNAHVYPRVYGDITKETFENKVFNMADMCNEAFTAEKQLELIKWLIQQNFYDERIIRSNYEKTCFYCSYLDDYCESEEFEKFEEALANVFNYLWQDLTDAEKVQIKNILE